MKKKPKPEGWYISKNYPHFDLPISMKAARRYVENPNIVARHDFYPFVGYEMKSRRYRGKEADASNKLRPIKYASHLDANIYSYYALELNRCNEECIKAAGIDDCVIGYRSGKGSNIDLAKQAFDEIKKRKNCVSIALDISDFYGHIDHKNLEAEWCRTLGVDKLSPDHLSIFRSLTKWTSVDRDLLAERLGLKKSDLPLRLVSSPSILRAIRKDDKTRPSTERIFETNSNKFGIPQGSPLSALLSNIFMFPFDVRMNKFASQVGGFYRRYSDDILFICDVSYKEKVLSEIDLALAERGSALKINHDKDHISTFSFDPKRQKISCDTPCQYLGFTFDGLKILIRSQTLSKFHRRIKFATRSVKRARNYAIRSGGKDAFFRKDLNKQLTHLGKQSFVGGYARLAKNTMNKKAIEQQIKGSYERITKELSTPLKKRKRK